MAMATEDYLDAIKAHYGFDGWLAADEAGRPALAHFIADLGPDTGLALKARTPTAARRGHYADHYVLPSEADADGEPSVHVLVNVATCASAVEAKEALIFALARVMAPHLPTCHDRGFELGDLGFCGLDDPPTLAMFVRNNLFVEVASVGRERTPVQALAQTIDSQIQDQLMAGAARG